MNSDLLDTKKPIDNPAEFLEEPGVQRFIEYRVRQRSNDPKEWKDIVQEVTLKLLQSKGCGFNGRSKRGTFLARVIDNLIIDLKRRELGRNYGRHPGIPTTVKEMGPEAALTYELVILQNKPAKEAYEQIRSTTPTFTLNFPGFQKLIDHLPVPANTPGNIRHFVTLEPNVAHREKAPLEAMSRNELLDIALQGLSSDEKLAIWMKFSLELTPQECAEKMGLTQDGFRKKIRRALEKASQQLKKTGVV